MTADTRIEDVKTLLDQINAADVAEDAAFQLQIDALSSGNAALVAERDALAIERDTLLAEKTASIADLVAVRDQLMASVAALDVRITALGG